MRKDQIKRAFAMLCVLTMLFGTLPTSAVADTFGSIQQSIQSQIQQNSSQPAETAAPVIESAPVEPSASTAGSDTEGQTGKADGSAPGSETTEAVPELKPADNTVQAELQVGGTVDVSISEAYPSALVSLNVRSAGTVNIVATGMALYADVQQGQSGNFKRYTADNDGPLVFAFEAQAGSYLLSFSSKYQQTGSIRVRAMDRSEFVAWMLAGSNVAADNPNAPVETKRTAKQEPIQLRTRSAVNNEAPVEQPAEAPVEQLAETEPAEVIPAEETTVPKFSFSQQEVKETVSETENVPESETVVEAVQEKVEELTKANEALQYENQGLRAKYAAVESVPLIYSGEEEEFYQGEIRDAILSSLNEILSATESATRKADILKDVLENNPYYHLAEERKQRVKSLFKGYKNLTGAMRQELLSLGFEITEEGKHYKITYREDPRYMVTIGKTPSDSRSGNNNAALISKKML